MVISEAGDRAQHYGNEEIVFERDVSVCERVIGVASSIVSR